MLTHAQGEDRTLPTTLSAEELAVESQKLAAAVEAVAKQEENIVEKTGVWKDAKKAMDGYLSHLKGEMNTLAATVESGIADRKVSCSWLHAMEQGYAFLVRDDTGELVTHRELGDGERTASDLEVIREPTEEQLAEWTASLGLADRAEFQPGLPLAEPGSPGETPPSGPRALPPLPYYHRQFVDIDGEPQAVVLRYSDPAKQPGQLTGVHVTERAKGKVPFEGIVHNGALEYLDDPAVLHLYREALEDELVDRRPVASATDELA